MRRLTLALATLTLLAAACDAGSGTAPKLDAAVVADADAANDDAGAATDTTTAPDTAAAADTLGGDSAKADVETADTAAAADKAGAVDATPDDTAAVEDTAGDPGVTQTPFGPIEGEACGTLTASLESDAPSFHVTTWTFTGETFDPSLLDPGAKRLFDSPNAGGSSKCGETMSVQWFVSCEGATLYKLETEILYDSEGSITDYAIDIDGVTYGVSVTRAYLGPFNTDYDVATAKSLLSDKLAGVNEATLHVNAADAWPKQVLHIWTLQPTWVPILEQAWTNLADPLKSDTVVLVTVEDGPGYVVTDTCDDD